MTLRAGEGLNLKMINYILKMEMLTTKFEVNISFWMDVDVC